MVHWPIAYVSGKALSPAGSDGWAELDLETSLVDTWKAMVALPKSKVAFLLPNSYMLFTAFEVQVRAIGVSNFTIEAIEGIVKATGVVPAANQIEAHPLLLQDDLFKYCSEKGVHLTAYSPLGNNLIGIPKLTEWPEGEL